jgi:hypothetical protein
VKNRIRLDLASASADGQKALMDKALALGANQVWAEAPDCTAGRFELA